MPTLFMNSSKIKTTLFDQTESLIDQKNTSNLIFSHKSSTQHGYSMIEIKYCIC